MGKVVYEHEEGQELPPDAVDGMEDMLGDDILSTDWDGDVEVRSIEHWGDPQDVK